MTPKQLELREKFLTMDKEGKVPTTKELEEAYSKEDLVLKLQKTLYRVMTLREHRDRLMGKNELIKELKRLKEEYKIYSPNSSMNEGYRVAIMDTIDLVKKLTM